MPDTNRIKIENGCVKLGANKWMYGFYQNGVRVQIQFTGEGTPEFGDFIEKGRLVKREGPQVAADYRKWKDKYSDTRARDKMDSPKTW